MAEDRLAKIQSMLAAQARKIDDEVHQCKMLLQNRDFRGMARSYRKAQKLINDSVDLVESLDRLGGLDK